MNSAQPEQSGHPSRSLVDVLLERFPNSSKQTLKRMVEQGRVAINGRQARKLSEPVRSDDDVAVRDRAKPQAVGGSVAPLEIIFEDEDLIIVNKPAGLLTSTVPREKRATALAILQRYLVGSGVGVRVGLIHRLDRDASALLVFSKNDLAYDSLKSQFFHHDVERVYRAVVHGVPKPTAGKIESQLVEFADGIVHVTKAEGKGQRAVTHYEVLREQKKLAELRIKLETGRKHQIRVHLASRGWPIVGDTVYGSGDKAPRLMLAAVQLGFMHPRGQEQVKFEIPAPVEMDRLFPPGLDRIVAP